MTPESGPVLAGETRDDMSERKWRECAKCGTIIHTFPRSGAKRARGDLCRDCWRPVPTNTPELEHADDCASGLGGPCDCHALWADTPNKTGER